MSTPLDLSWVGERLAIGGCYPAEAAGELATVHGIRRIVDLRREACDDALALRPHGIVLLHLPTIDRAPSSGAQLGRGVAWVTREFGRGHRVLVHCQHGIGRSALLALCVLVRLGTDPLVALRQAKDAREQVSPSPEQLQAYLAFCGEEPSAPPLPTLEALMTIAYRHLAQGAG